MNRKAHVTVKTSFSDSDPFITTDLLKQGTCPGPILNNCSFSDICTEGNNFNYGSVQIKSLEYVDDIEDPNSGNADAVFSNDIICNIQRRKRFKFSTEKCKLLKVNSKDNGDTISISGEKVEIKTSFRYLGDFFNYHDNSDLCKERARKAIGTSTEIISLCKEINFGKNQISEMLLLYHLVFLPRIVYNCEAWTNLTCKDYSCLENAQKNFLRHVVEVPKSTPTSGLFLEMGILPVQFVIEVRQLMFPKKIITRDPSDPVKKVYL